MQARGFNSVHSWCIAVGCAFVNLVTQGPAKLAGLLFVATLERYDTDRALASWPFTISVIMRCTADMDHISVRTYVNRSKILGYFRDNLGSYNGLIYLEGAIDLACCLPILMIPCLIRHKKAKENKAVKSKRISH